jgi:hypothetical protein
VGQTRSGGPGGKQTDTELRGVCIEFHEADLSELTGSELGPERERFAERGDIQRRPAATQIQDAI